jgi:hypothetical protein
MHFAMAGQFEECLKACTIKPEPVFLNGYGAQESIPRNEFRQAM